MASRNRLVLEKGTTSWKSGLNSKCEDLLDLVARSRISFQLSCSRSREDLRGIHGFHFVNVSNILGQGETADGREEENDETSSIFLSAAWKRARSTDISTYLNVATGNACAGQSNEKPVPFVTRNPTSFTDGNCGLLLDAGSKNRTRDRDTERSCVKGRL